MSETIESAEEREHVSPGSFVKIYGTILRSSIWNESSDTRCLWITMLADADAEGYVRGSVGGLARLANISREAAAEGLRVLAAPDPDSRSPEHDGRRIEEVGPGTWRILNYRRWRELRSPQQIAAADRQQRRRDRERDERDASRSSRAVTPRSPSPSPSSSSSSQEDQEQENSTGREGIDARTPFRPDPLDRVLADAELDLSQFGERETKIVRSWLRTLRAPFAAAVILRGWLVDEETPPKVLAIAVQEYAGLGGDRIEARHFAGFVRRARAFVEQQPARAMDRSEQRFIAQEAAERVEEQREEADARSLVETFRAEHPERYADLLAEAERSVDSRIGGAFRAPMVETALARLIRLRTRGDA
jgi:hypothetical protein